jgi:chromosome segregation ATPase
MLEQIMTPELVLFGGIFACGIAVLALFLAGRSAFVQDLTNRLATLEIQIEDKRKILQDIGNKTADADLLTGRAENLEKRLNALQQELKPIEEKHLKAIIDYEDVKGKLRQTADQWRQMTEQVETYKTRVSQIDSLEQEIKDLTERRKQIDENLKNLADHQKAFEQLSQSIDEKSNELENQKQELQNIYKLSELAQEQLQPAAT